MTGSCSSEAGKLLDDCFAHDPRRLPAADALRLLRQRVTPMVEAENVSLTAAYGRFLAKAVVSGRDVPSFDNVAVDGYAFAHGSVDPDGASRLRLVTGRAAAGHPFEGTVPPGHAIRVLTGAALPAGTDTAVMQEDVSAPGNGHLVIPAGTRPGMNCRRAGEDMRRGQTVLEPGCRLRPQDVGVAATVGLKTLSVFRPLHVALVSSGDELREPGEPLPHGMTYDSNRTILRGLLQGLGVTVSDQGIWPDRMEVVEREMAKIAGRHQVVITSGGASRGDEDHMVDAVRKLGSIHFWQIAIKPGRPLAFGQVDDAIFIGLPGNPVAAVVCFLLFVRPMLTSLAGGSWPEPRSFAVPADFAMSKKAGRREYLRARLLHGPDGGLRVRKIEREGSGILTSLTEADGLVDLGEDTTSVAPGDLVPFMPFNEFGF